MTNDEEKTREEKIAELRRHLLEGRPVIEIGNPMRCDTCDMVVDHWVWGKDEIGKFHKCPNCGNLVRVRGVPKLIIDQSLFPKHNVVNCARSI